MTKPLENQQYFDTLWQEGAKGNKKPLSQLFKFKQFAGNPCFIVGGGPSLRGFDFSLLKGKYTIGINFILKVFHPWLLMTWDKVCYDWLLYQFYTCPLVVVDVDNSYRDNCYYVRSAGRYGLPYSIDRIFIGEHMGYAAINLAIAMGFNPIYLLGFDYISINGNYHVTDDWGHARDADDKFLRFRKEIDQMSGYLNGNSIINLSPMSALASFPKKGIEEVISESEK